MTQFSSPHLQVILAPAVARHILANPFNNSVVTARDLCMQPQIFAGEAGNLPNAANSTDSGVYAWWLQFKTGAAVEAAGGRDYQKQVILEGSRKYRTERAKENKTAWRYFIYLNSVTKAVFAANGTRLIYLGCTVNFSTRYIDRNKSELHFFCRELSYKYPALFSFTYKVLDTCSHNTDVCLDLEEQLGVHAGMDVAWSEEDWFSGGKLMLNQLMLGAQSMNALGWREWNRSRGHIMWSEFAYDKCGNETTEFASTVEWYLACQRDFSYRRDALLQRLITCGFLNADDCAEDNGKLLVPLLLKYINPAARKIDHTFSPHAAGVLFSARLRPFAILALDMHMRSPPFPATPTPLRNPRWKAFVVIAGNTPANMTAVQKWWEKLCADPSPRPAGAAMLDLEFWNNRWVGVYATIQQAKKNAAAEIQQKKAEEMDTSPSAAAACSPSPAAAAAAAAPDAATKKNKARTAPAAGLKASTRAEKSPLNSTTPSPAHSRSDC